MTVPIIRLDYQCGWYNGCLVDWKEEVRPFQVILQALILLV